MLCMYLVTTDEGKHLTVIANNCMEAFRMVEDCITYNPDAPWSWGKVVKVEAVPLVAQTNRRSYPDIIIT